MAIMSKKHNIVLKPGGDYGDYLFLKKVRDIISPKLEYLES